MVSLFSELKYSGDSAEQTTAITDIVLAFVAFGGVWFLREIASNNADLWKINLWSTAIGLIGVAAALGAAAHGLILPQGIHRRIWQLLNMALALAVSLFVAGVVNDLWGYAACVRILPVVSMTGLGFYLATLRYPGIFFVFNVYAALALLFAFGAYVLLAIRAGSIGAGLMAAGILVSLIAAAIQTKKSISVTVIWQFDHNGIYHLVQVVGLILLLIGLGWSLRY